MKNIKIIGALVFIISILLAILFNYIDEQNKVNINILDRINKQKALTQEISKNIFYMYKNKKKFNFQFNNSIKKFLSDINNEENKIDEINSLAIINQNKKISVLWNKFYLKVEQFRNKNNTNNPYSNLISEKLLNDIYKINLTLVLEFNKLIDLHKEEFKKNIKKYKRIEHFLFLLLIIFLIYLFTQIEKIFLFIQRFLIISKKILKNSALENLEPIKTDNISSNKSLFDATDNFNSLINKVNNSVTNSIQSIENSSKSLEIVEKNIEDLMEFIYNIEMENNKDLTKKEDIIIQLLEELTNSVQNLQTLKTELEYIISKKSNT